MGEAIRAFDWAATPLGAPADWSSPLRTAVALMLGASQPVYIAYGPELISLYNDGYLPIVGDKHPAGLGAPFSVLWAEIWKDFKPIVEATMAGAAQHFVDLPIAIGGRPDVPMGYFTFSYTALRDDGGATVGFYCAATETTKQVEQSRRLIESDERLQLALASGRGIGTWDWDVPNDRVVADMRFAALYGVNPARAKAGAPIAEFFAGIHPDDIDSVQSSVADALRKGDAFSAEYRLVQPDGSSKWVVAEGRCQLAHDGSPIRFPGISFDISDRKASERRAQVLIDLTDSIRGLEKADDVAFAASTLLGKTLEVSRVSYGTIDPVAETLTVERDWLAAGVDSVAGTLNLRDYGSFIDDLKLGNFIVIPDVERDARTSGPAADALKARSAAAFVNVPVLENGRLVAVLFLNNAQPRAWSDEDLALVLEVAERTRTATERLRVSQELREANDNLEARIAERTAELMRTEEALRQSQKMEAVGQLTGGIAHDFNNLLTGISGSLERMQVRIAQGRTGEVGRYVAAAQGAAERAAALTHRLLAFSRRQTLDPKPVAVNRLVADMAELIRRTVGPAVALEVVGAGGLWPTLADANQLENALLNLCINARDAMPDGGKITIETANKWLDDRASRDRDLPPGQYISVCVTDTGTGMTPEVMERAFEPFYTTKPLGVGTGLGLSMIYGFARQSGGQVRIYSEVGHGTTMCIYLPRLFGETDLVDTDVGAVLGAEALAGETVLVIDDEPLVRMLIVEVLEEAGFTPLEAEDGASGLRILQSGVRIDLLITDVGLPGGMNGRQVADAGRVTRPDLKVLFITGYAENAVVGNGHLDPHMSILTKPFAMDILSGKINEIMRGE